MNRTCKLVAAMLAGVLSATMLASCRGVQNEQISSSATTAQPETEEAPRAIVSPEELHKLLLNTADFAVESKLLQTYPTYEYVWNYSMEKDGDLIKTDFYEKDGAFDAVEETNYADLERAVYYEIRPNDWIFYPLENTFYADGVSAFLYDLSPMDGNLLWKDSSYEAYDPETVSYSVKDSVLKKVFRENDWDTLPEEYSLTYTEAYGKYTFTYYWKDGSVTSEMKTVVTLRDTVVSLPKAENDPIAEVPYQGEKMEIILNNFDQIDLTTQLADFYTIGFTPWEGEEAERLFDGVKTYEQWYYDADGNLKEEADPDAAEGGGPGKCAGVIANYCQFVFRFEHIKKIAAYVITNANDNEEFDDRTPARWTLFGTNDELAADPETAEDAQWVIVDYVWEGGIESENFAENCYLIDKENRGYYQYYAIEITDYSGNQLQIGELEFYAE
ncbi:MAG: hypothetical protein IJX47_08075 [Clostridia bacterium]|nr:hypothetical protein [Clostridia bacterium]